MTLNTKASEFLLWYFLHQTNVRSINNYLLIVPISISSILCMTMQNINNIHEQHTTNKYNYSTNTSPTHHQHTTNTPHKHGLPTYTRHLHAFLQSITRQVSCPPSYTDKSYGRIMGNQFHGRLYFYLVSFLK